MSDSASLIKRFPAPLSSKGASIRLGLLGVGRILATVAVISLFKNEFPYWLLLHFSGFISQVFVRKSGTKQFFTHILP